MFFVLYKRQNIDKNIIYLIIGLVLTFVSLIAPIELDGNHITLFWAFEAVILLWLYTKSKIKLMEVAAMVINLLLIISLVMDWQQNYFPTGEYVQLPILFNKVFITTLIVLGSIVGSFTILKKLNPTDIIASFPVTKINGLMQIGFLVTLYFGVLFELNYQFIDAEFPVSKTMILLGIYNFTFMSALMVFTRKPQTPKWNTVLLGLSTVLMISYITVYLNSVVNARDLMLNYPETASGYYLHYILLAGFAALSTLVLRQVNKQFSWGSNIGNMVLYSFSTLLVGCNFSRSDSHFNYLPI